MKWKQQHQPHLLQVCYSSHKWSCTLLTRLCRPIQRSMKTLRLSVEVMALSYLWREYLWWKIKFSGKLKAIIDQFWSWYQLELLPAKKSMLQLFSNFVCGSKHDSLWDFLCISCIEGSYRYNRCLLKQLWASRKISWSLNNTVVIVPRLRRAVAGPEEVLSWLCSGLEKGSCCADFNLGWIWVGKTTRYTGILVGPSLFSALWVRRPGQCLW